MNAAMPLCMAQALAAFAPPSSIVHKIVSDDQAQRIDAAMLAEKARDGYAVKIQERAMRLQLQRQNLRGGAL